MQTRVVLVSAAVLALGAAATVLGFLAENTKYKSFVRFDGQRCVYRRTPALVYGVVAALLALAALALATAASGCLRRGAPAPAYSRRRTIAVRLSAIAWLVVVVAVIFFLYGAAMNRGGTRGLSASRWGRRYRYGDGGYYYYGYGCSVLKSGVFATAAVLSAVATACAVAGYVGFQRTDDEPAPPAHFVAPPPGVAMGQPQWAQPYPPPAYPPPPMAYPAPPPQYGHGGYGPKQPAGTA